MDWSELISRVMGSSEKCSSDVYITGDNELSTCADLMMNLGTKHLLKA